MTYPFTAIIGQEAMQTALLVTAVDPKIGGVLVRGQKGTAKSTAARALAGLLPSIEIVADCSFNCPPGSPEFMHPGCRQRHDKGETLTTEVRPTPFIDLPLSTTEDRLVGTLHLEKTLQSGQREFEPGLLASANRGILYVDEVNLLPDHLVDLLLDTAASGRNLVEREGLRYSHPSSFVLIGTMNPEEGELRPQFLDRFGLCVSITGIEENDLRRRIVKDRLAFDLDAESFYQNHREQEETLQEQIVSARTKLTMVAVSDEMIDLAVDLASRVKAQGHRAELALVRTAKALAALCDRDRVTRADLLEAAHFALPHRATVSHNRSIETIADDLSSLIQDEAVSPHSDQDDLVHHPEADAEWLENMDFPGSAAAGSMLFTYLKKKSMIVTSSPTKPST